MSNPRGKLTAIVGESGSGKSTLLSLLQNLYPLQKGTIFLGQQDIRYLKPESLRTFVGVVPQQIDLFAGTVLQNIAVGECNPDLQRVITLCNALEITSFVEKLPGGFNALLGERGANLSGGQRQRLAIARALYRNPEILILDEATSALDSIAEQSVQQMIRMLQKAGKTIIVIAHRLSTVRNADQIIVLKQGQVQEIGTHDELLQKQGNYTELWRRQMDIL
ncbi:ABC transporter ATP-binding protein [Siphonobacter sp. BAB-5405]|uniref:ABC transporter ATP-binding protein n=1 Tax=Siphonobacter sp. BAB-5405 TaxID=1864825 RepID=UPI003512BDFF